MSKAELVEDRAMERIAREVRREVALRERAAEADRRTSNYLDAIAARVHSAKCRPSKRWALRAAIHAHDRLPGPVVRRDDLIPA